MNPQDDETLWRNRFIAINLVRIGGTIIVLIGLAIWHGNLLVEGGPLAVGLPITLAGLVASFSLIVWFALPSLVDGHAVAGRAERDAHDGLRLRCRDGLSRRRVQRPRDDLLRPLDVQI